MSAAHPDGATWTFRNWAGLISGVFVLEIALVLLLSDRTRTLPREPRSTLKLAILNAAESDRRLAELAVPSDPTLFALASSREFTGVAWQRANPTSPRLPEWKDSTPAGWNRTPVGLGLAPAAFLRSNAIPALSVVARSPGALDGLASANVPRRSHSTIHTGGALATRPLLLPLDAPSWPHPDLLTNTIIEVTVNQQGLAVSASRRQGSGSPTADQKALEIARSIRFQTSSVPDLQRGLLTFEWHTIAPTNPPSATSP